MKGAKALTSDTFPPAATGPPSLGVENMLAYDALIMLTWALVLAEVQGLLQEELPNLLQLCPFIYDSKIYQDLIARYGQSKVISNIPWVIRVSSSLTTLRTLTDMMKGTSVLFIL